MSRKTVITFAILLLFVLSFSGKLSAQPWMKSPYLKTKRGDTASVLNFYTIQKAFNAYYKKKQKEERKEEREREERKKEKTFNTRETAEEEAEDGEIEKFKRWEWFMEPRVYPSGDITLPSHTWDEFQKYLNTPQYRTFANSRQKSTQSLTGNWKSIGPFNAPTSTNLGRITFIRFNPTDTNKIWVGAPNGGLWKTTDGGATWSTNTDQFSVVGCSDLVIDPTNTDIMYLATGDPESVLGATSSIGILKTIDGGTTWIPTSLSWPVNLGRRMRKLLINPSNTNIIIAATSVGMYRTTDGGLTWTQVIAGDFTDLQFRPGDPSIVYAVTQRPGNFFKSIDSGATFSVVTSGLPATPAVYRYAIGVTSADSSYVYLVGSDASKYGFYGLYLSKDTANNFTLQSNSPNIIGTQGWYDLAIAVNPVNKNDVYVGAVSHFHSTDAGINWTEIAGFTHPDVHVMQFLQDSTPTLFEGNDGGIFKTRDSGNTWMDISNGLAISQMYRIGTSATDTSLNLIGLQDNGTIKSLPHGQWDLAFGGDGMECIVDYTNPNIMYASFQNGTILKSTNGGVNQDFTRILKDSGTGVDTLGSWITPYIMDPVDHNKLYVGKAQVFASSNAGSTWTKLGQVGGGNGYIVSLAVAPSNTKFIYAAKATSFFASKDGGNTWADKTSGLLISSAVITAIAVSNTDSNKVWVTLSGYASGNKVFFSDNAGDTWTNYSTGLPNLPVNCIVYQNNTNDGVYVGTDVGVYFRSNTLSAWQPYFTGMPNVVVDELEIQYSAGKIKAATYGRGLWESDLAIPQADFTANPTTICIGSSVSFNGQSKDAVDVWTWSFSGGVATATTQNPTITFNTAGIFDVSLTAANVNGYTTKVRTGYITVVATAPLQPGNITGSTNPCFNTTQTYSITPVAGTASYTWMLPSGWAGTSTNTSIQTVVANAAGIITVTASNVCGVSAAQTLTVTVNQVPSPAAEIAGNVFPCASTSQIYSITPVANASSYTWTYPAGWSTSGSGTTTITFGTVGTNSGLVQVRANNVCGSSSVQSSAITVNRIPSQPGLIAGNTSVCLGATQTYTISNVAGATSYIWTYPADWTPAGNTTGTSITFTTGSSGTLSVKSNNVCGTSSSRNVNVVVNQIPQQPIVINGNSTVCAGSAQTYSITSVSGATSYSWAFAAGWTTTGSSGTSLTFSSVGTSTGTIFVRANNSCGSSDYQTLTVAVNQKPQAPSVIAGNTTVCSGSAQTYSVAPVAGATNYTWSYPSGWTSAGSTTNIISFNPISANSGNITVTAGNTCGNSNGQTLSVTVNQPPQQPASITGNTSVNVGQTITYSISPVANTNNYNWNITGGGTITNSPITSADVLWNVAGTYTITVNAQNDCGTSTATSVTVNVFNPTAVINPDDEFKIQVLPNPTTGIFYVKAKGVNNKSIDVEVISNNGQLVYSYKTKATSNEFLHSIDLQNAADGMYEVQIIVDKKVYVRQVIKIGN